MGNHVVNHFLAKMNQTPIQPNMAIFGTAAPAAAGIAQAELRVATARLLADGFQAPREKCFGLTLKQEWTVSRICSIEASAGSAS